jgi:hypothetical protein
MFWGGVMRFGWVAGLFAGLLVCLLVGLLDRLWHVFL